MTTGKGYRGGFNPYRDAHGRYATATTHGAQLMNVAIRQAAGRHVARSYGGDYTPAAAAVLRQHEDAIRNLPHESVAIIAPDGTTRLFRPGDTSGFKLTDAEMALLPGAIMTHNHPVSASDGYAEVSFSGQDIIAGLHSGESETRAVTKRFNHVIQYRTPGTTTSINRSLSQMQNMDIYMALSDAYDWDQSAPPEVQRQQVEDAMHTMNKQLAAQYGYVYYREHIETGEIDGYGYD